MIQTPEDWWGLYDDRLADIEEIIRNVYGPNALYSFMWQEKMHWDGDSATLRDEMTALRFLENGQELSSLLNKVWCDAPDTPHIHSWPGWQDFCDLCSENWVFYEE